MNIEQIQCSVSRAPTLHVRLEMVKSRKFLSQDSPELQNSINFICLLHCKLNWYKCTRQTIESLAPGGFAYHWAELILPVYNARCEVEYQYVFSK